MKLPRSELAIVAFGLLCLIGIWTATFLHIVAPEIEATRAEAASSE